MSFMCQPNVDRFIIEVSDCTGRKHEHLAGHLWINKVKLLTWSCSLVFWLLVFFFSSVRFPEDLEDDNTTFNPEYSHQVFGDE